MLKTTKLTDVASGIWVWYSYNLEIKLSLYSAMLQCQDGLVIIDPVELHEDDLHRIHAIGQVSAIILTSAHHGRAASIYRERFSAPILAHHGSLDELNVSADGSLRPARKIAGNLQVIEIEGAAPGEVALYRESGHLHFGDAVEHDKNGLQIMASRGGTPARLARALRKLANTSVQSITFSHSAPLLSATQTHFDKFQGNLLSVSH